MPSDRITAGPIENIMNPEKVTRSGYVIFRKGFRTEDGLARLMLEDLGGGIALPKVPGDLPHNEITFLGEVQRFLREHDAYLAHAHYSVGTPDSIAGDWYYYKKDSKKEDSGKEDRG